MAFSQAYEENSNWSVAASSETEPASMLKRCLSAMALISVCLVTHVNNSKADTLQSITLSTDWRYNQTGTNLGAAWIAPDYDDTVAGWEGPGLPLFGFETDE